MADGGQRLLDVIDDPNALESFLGGLTAESDLLPTAESVDNVVASLARSLEADYEVDSPNETLFDTLEASNHLTDISKSYVPSDFENAISDVHCQPYTNNAVGSLPNGDIGQQLLQSHQHQNQVVSSIASSDVGQFILPSNQSSSTYGNCNNIATPFTTSNCDSSTVSSNLLFSQNDQVSVSQNQGTLSSTNGGQSQFFFPKELSKTSADSPQPSLSSLSTSLSNTPPTIISSVSNSTSQDNSHSLPSSSSPAIPNIQLPVSTGRASQPTTQYVSVPASAAASTAAVSAGSSSSSSAHSVARTLPINGVGVSSSANNTTVVSPQFLTSASAQTATLNQLVAGQVSLANVGGAQIIATSNGNIVATGSNQTNILQQLQQSAGAGQSYITMEQPTATALIAGPAAFGATNLALVTTGGAPTYAVVPAGAQLLSNAIVAQQPALQAIAKGPNGAFFQTTGGQLVATSSVAAGAQSVTAGSVTNNASNANKPKQPVQLLPKPQSAAGTVSGNSAASGSGSIAHGSSGSSTTASAETPPTSQTSSSSGSAQQGTPSSSAETVVTQLFQQQPQQIQTIQNQVVVTSVGNNAAVTIPQQTSFTIGGATGIGQVVVSQNPTPQALAGTIVLNQYGQPVILNTAPAGQTGSVQLIVRQQPQTPVLALQTPQTATLGTQASPGGKPIVRYVPQSPQSAGYGLQQIQTPNGPAWVAVRYPQASTSLPSSGGVTQLSAETLQSSNVISSAQPQVQLQFPTTPTSQSQESKPQTPVTMASAPSSTPSTPQRSDSFSTPSKQDNSDNGPPAKKAKSRSKSSKKKVTLDLEQLLKQSGIMDEDLQDDSSFDFSISSQDTSLNGISSSYANTPEASVSTPAISAAKQETPVSTPVNTEKKVTKKASKKKKSQDKQRSPPPTPPPPPPPTTTTTTPKSSKSKKKGGGSQKADSKTENSKSETPKKLSSIDDISATIAAVAAAAASPSPPGSPTSTTTRSTTTSTSNKVPTPKTPTTTTNLSNSSNAASAQSITKSLPSQSTTSSAVQPTPVVFVTTASSAAASATAVTPSTSASPAGTPTRIVQTIQLTPQNQTLLRNIQAQISRLLSFQKRNETEETALQKLIVLQQQVIATGVPVPNPRHLNNLTPNANSATVVPASTLSSAVGSGGISVTAVGDSVNPSASFNCSTDWDTNNIAVTVSTPCNQITSPSTTVTIKRPPKASPNRLSSSVTKASPLVENPADSNSLANGGLGSINQLSCVKVVIASSSSDTVNGTSDDNKENTSGGHSMVVSSSTFSSGTNTTNALSHHHLQTFPSQFRSSVDEKKAEEQRIALQKAEEEKRARWKKEEFEMLLKRDQQCVTQPDYEIPFSSKRDAVERLMKYHILRDRNDMNFEEFDMEFGEKAGLLLDKFHGMLSKYRSLLLKESMKDVGCAERVMLERMFVSEEKVKLEQDRLLVSQGEILELAPPPPSWIPKIQEMVEKEVKEMEQDSYVNQQVQSAIDSIIGIGGADSSNTNIDDNENKMEYDAFGVPINNNGMYNNGMNSSSADIDEAVRSILS